jgi:hypothetical protein
MQRKIWAQLSSMTCLLAFATASRADEITTVQSTTRLPGGSSVTVNQITQGNPANAVPLRRTTLIMPTGPVASSSSSSTLIEKQGLGNPIYIKRVENLREQLNTALAKGWLNSADASPFQMRIDDLSAKAHAVDMSTSYSNSLEKEINSLNIDLSQKLAGH